MKEIILLLAGAVIGWAGQWLFYRYQKRDEKRQGPNIIISRVVKADQIMIGLRNVGPDSLSEMVVQIEWTKDGEDKHRILQQFFLPEQDERLVNPIHVEVLGPSDRYNVIGLPQWAENGIVDVQISGIGVNSRRSYNKSDQVPVGQPPR